MELKGSRTEANLLAAFAGESEARNKYTYFASRAKKEGFEQIAAIFQKTADNEKEHAEMWFKELGLLNDTASNLAAAAEGENYELTDMYVTFAKEAEEEGFAEIARKFITGLEVLSPGPEQAARPKPSRLRKVLRALGRFILPALLWAALAMIFTGFVFNQITDAAPADKIVIYADCELQNAPELAEKLEQALDGSVRMVKIHPFTYAMFDSVRLKQADLYIIPDSRLADYRDWLSAEEGIPVSDPASGLAAAGDYFLYEPGGLYRIYTGRSSVHLEDGLTSLTAELLVSMTEPEKEGTP